MSLKSTYSGMYLRTQHIMWFNSQQRQETHWYSWNLTKRVPRIFFFVGVKKGKWSCSMQCGQVVAFGERAWCCSRCRKAPSCLRSGTRPLPQGPPKWRCGTTVSCQSSINGRVHRYVWRPMISLCWWLRASYIFCTKNRNTTTTNQQIIFSLS